MSVPGVGTGAMPMGIMSGQQSDDPKQMQEQAIIKMVRAINNSRLCEAMLTKPQMTGAAESCAGKTAMSGVMGFALGGAFGLFMSSVRCLPSSIQTRQL